MAIMSMITVAAWASFRTLRKSMEISEVVQQRYSVLRNCLSRMSSEISMSYLSWNRPRDSDKHYTMFEGYDQGDRDVLTFSNFAHVRLRRNAAESDQGVIQYVLADDPDGKRTHVYRREANRPMGDQPDRLEDWFPAYVFCEDINSLNFEYWDDKQNDWRTEWRTTKNDFQPDRLPQRVKITLGVLDDEGDKHFYTTQTILFMQEKIDMSK